MCECAYTFNAVTTRFRSTYLLSAFCIVGLLITNLFELSIKCVCTVHSTPANELHSVAPHPSAIQHCVARPRTRAPIWIVYIRIVWRTRVRDVGSGTAAANRAAPRYAARQTVWTAELNVPTRGFCSTSATTYLACPPPPLVSEYNPKRAQFCVRLVICALNVVPQIMCLCAS